MRQQDWRILAAVVVGGGAGIASVLLLMSWVQPDSISGFLPVGAIVLFVMLLLFSIACVDERPLLKELCLSINRAHDGRFQGLTLQLLTKV
jgi:hypothetical protein